MENWIETLNYLVTQHFILDAYESDILWHRHSRFTYTQETYCVIIT